MNMMLLLLLFAPVVLCFHPVILLPGDLGSQIEAKLDRRTTSHWYCAKTSDWYLIWLSPDKMVGPPFTCWADDFQLEFKDGKFSNVDGVETRTRDFGGLNGVSYIDNIYVIKYYKPLIDVLMKLPGAEEGVNIRGAPYDFRYAPPSAQNTQYNENLKALIEETYTINNKTSVVLVGHSMGNPIITTFLNQRSKEWKDMYIRSYVAISGAFAGATKPIKALTTGLREHVPGFILDANVMRTHIRTIQSSYWLLPQYPYWTDEVLVSTPRRNYTAKDYEDLFTDMGFSQGSEMYATVKESQQMTNDPGVKTFCFNGKNTPTTDSYIWRTEASFPDDDPEEAYGIGDGTVPYRSLQVCHRWASTKGIFEYSGSSGTHYWILYNEDMLDIIGNYIATGLM